MMTQFTTFNLGLGILGLGILAACDTAVPPTQGQADLNVATATYNSLRLATPIDAAATPSGSGTYTGKFGSSAVTINTEDGYGIVGDLSLNIAFSGDATNVTGALRDINLIDRITADGSQVMTDGTGGRMPGSLTISGSEVGGAIAATATGQLGAVLANSGTETTTQMNVPLTGQLRTTSALGDTVTGTFTGTGRGSLFSGMDVTISDGVFYGRE